MQTAGWLHKGIGLDYKNIVLIFRGKKRIGQRGGFKDLLIIW